MDVVQSRLVSQYGKYSGEIAAYTSLLILYEDLTPVTENNQSEWEEINYRYTVRQTIVA